MERRREVSDDIIGLQISSMPKNLGNPCSFYLRPYIVVLLNWFELEFCHFQLKEA